MLNILKSSKAVTNSAVMFRQDRWNEFVRFSCQLVSNEWTGRWWSSALERIDVDARRDDTTRCMAHELTRGELLVLLVALGI